MEKVVNFSVVKQKIIKTDEVLRMCVDTTTQLKKVQSAFKQCKVKLEQSKAEVERLKLDNDRTTYSLESAKTKYDTLEKLYAALQDRCGNLEVKYGQTVNDHQLTYQNLHDELIECRKKLQNLETIDSVDISPKKRRSSKKSIDFGTQTEKECYCTQQKIYNDKNEILQLRMENKNITELLKTNKEMNEMKICSLRAENWSLNSEINNFKSQVDNYKSLENECINLQKANEHLQKLIIKLEEQSKEKSIELTEKLSKSENLVGVLRNENHQLQNELAILKHKSITNIVSQKGIHTDDAAAACVESDEESVGGFLSEMIGLPCLLSPINDFRSNSGEIYSPLSVKDNLSEDIPEIVITPATPKEKEFSERIDANIDYEEEPVKTISKPVRVSSGISLNQSVKTRSVAVKNYNRKTECNKYINAKKHLIWLTRTNTFIKQIRYSKKRNMLHSMKRLIKKKIVNERKEQEQDNVMQALLTLQKCNIPLSIPSDKIISLSNSGSLNKISAQKIKIEGKNLENSVEVQKIDSYVINLDCSFKTCDGNNSMILNKKDELLGFFSVKDKEVKDSVSTVVLNNNKINLNPLNDVKEKEILENDILKNAITSDKFLDTLADLVSKKLKQNMRGNKRKTSAKTNLDYYDSFHSETEPEIEHLFKNEKANILQRNKMLLNKAKQQKHVSSVNSTAANSEENDTLQSETDLSELVFRTPSVLSLKKIESPSYDVKMLNHRCPPLISPLHSATKTTTKKKSRSSPSSSTLKRAKQKITFDEKNNSTVPIKRKKVSPRKNENSSNCESLFGSLSFDSDSDLDCIARGNNITSKKVLKNTTKNITGSNRKHEMSTRDASTLSCKDEMNSELKQKNPVSKEQFFNIKNKSDKGNVNSKKLESRVSIFDPIEDITPPKNKFHDKKTHKPVYDIKGLDASVNSKSKNSVILQNCENSLGLSNGAVLDLNKHKQMKNKILPKGSQSDSESVESIYENHKSVDSGFSENLTDICDVVPKSDTKKVINIIHNIILPTDMEEFNKQLNESYKTDVDDINKSSYPIDPSKPKNSIFSPSNVTRQNYSYLNKHTSEGVISNSNSDTNKKLKQDDKLSLYAEAVSINQELIQVPEDQKKFVRHISNGEDISQKASLLETVAQQLAELRKLQCSNEAKTTFKRPLSISRDGRRRSKPSKSPVLDCPKSPALECPKSPDQYDTLDVPNVVEPKIIPLEKPPKLPISKAKLLFEKLVTYSREEKTLNEIVPHFLNQDEDYIAGLILQNISADFDSADSKYSPAPIMTETQRVFLGFMSKLETCNMQNIYDAFLKKAEEYLFLTPASESVVPVTRLYVGICKLRKDLNRMRRFCCEVFYFMNDMAIPLFFSVLTSWAEVLPHESQSKDYPMAKVLVHVINEKSCKDVTTLKPLQELLSKFYNYPRGQWYSDTVIIELLNNYLRNPNRLSDFALLIFCKNQQSKWVYKKIEEHFIPLVEKIPTENFKATMIILVASICNQFDANKKEDYELINKVRTWLRSLKTETATDLINRSILLGLRRLPTKTTPKCKKKTE